MISPMTAPGTKIVCINDDAHSLNPPFSVTGRPIQYRHGLEGLRAGVVYTVRDLFFDRDFSEVLVRLAEIVRPLDSTGIESGYALSRFRLADLPRCLTELLEPVNLPREALV